MQRIEQLLDHRPSDEARALEAVTHPSFLHTNPGAGASNQRLEFLGDAVLGLVVAEAMYRGVGDEEGRLTRGRARVVSTKSLAAAARRISLGPLLRMSDAARRGGDDQRDKVLADGFEALIALAYEEGGLELAGRFVARHLAPELRAALEGGAELSNPKSALSERCQEVDGKPPQYRLVGKTGPDHAPEHRVVVLWGQNDAVFGRGAGIKAAQMNAAEQALAHWFKEDA